MDDNHQSLDNFVGEKATFGMGCFWVSDVVFGCQEGVARVRIGYCGGTGINPNFKKIGDFIEAVEVEFNPFKTSFEKLIEVFWKNHDSSKEQPRQHASVIFYHTPDQMKVAEESLKDKKQQISSIVTKIVPAPEFYVAEDYHQKHFLQQHPEIVTSLNIPQNRLNRSHLATKLNSYIAGYGTLELFDSEVESFGLTQVTEKSIRELILTSTPGKLICKEISKESEEETAVTSPSGIFN